VTQPINHGILKLNPPIIGGLIWASYLVLSVILYFPILSAFFLWDDISILSIATPLGGQSLWECWLPMSNGFWRPLPLSISWLLVFFFGLSPIAFHLLPILFHSLNAILLRQVALNHGMGFKWGTVLGYLFISHFAAFPAVSMMQNLMDVLLGTGVLLSLFIVDGSQPTFPFGRFSIIFLLTLTCKETAGLLPILALVWLWGTASDHSWQKLKSILPTATFLICQSVFAISLSLFMQYNMENSYTQQGVLEFQPLSLIRQMCDYILSLIFPFIHVVEFPILPIILSHILLWIIRALVIMVLAITILGFYRSQQFIPVSLIFIVVCILLPACLLDGFPHGRFLYAALAPTILIVAIWIMQSSQLIKRIVFLTSIIMLPISIISFYASPTVTHYVLAAKQVEQFMNESLEVSEKWSDGDEIAIYDHPHPGENPIRWTYCQQLYNLFLNGKKVTLLLDWSSPTTKHVYRYDQGHLEPMQD
jgi:hypothetical protein